MKVITLALSILISVSAFAESWDSFFDFFAPSVTNPEDNLKGVQVGSIVYDAKNDAFKGFFNTGSGNDGEWKELLNSDAELVDAVITESGGIGTPYLCSFRREDQCASGSCSFDSVQGDCLGSPEVEVNSTGHYTINFATDFWASAPVCVSSSQGELSFTASSTSSVDFYARSSAGSIAGNTTRWTIICHGFAQ